MSWERKLWEEEQKTQVLLEELSYSQEQRRIDELVYGQEALDEDWASRGQQRGPFGWLLGSPYHRRLGGQVYVYLWIAALACTLGLLGLGLRLVANWQIKQQQQLQSTQQAGRPQGSHSKPPGSADQSNGPTP